MPVVTSLGAIRDHTESVKGPQRVNFVRVYASGGLTSWSTSSRAVQYFGPPLQYAVFNRSGFIDVVSSAALGANVRLQYNPALNNRWLTARMQIGATECMNISNLNNGYDRCVRQPSMKVEDFYGNSRLDSQDWTCGVSAGQSPSTMIGGTQQLLTSTAAIPAVNQILTENRFLPYYYTSNTGVYFAGSQNTPSEVYLFDPNTAVSFKLYDRFKNWPGTVLSCPVALPTSTFMLEVVQDTVDKSFAAVTLPNSDDYADLNTAISNTAFASVGSANITVNNILSLCVLANDNIENATGMYTSMLGNGVEVELPWIDQINQSIGSAAGAFATNTSLPVASRRVKYISSALVIQGTNCRNTQCNGAVSGMQLQQVRAFVNNTPDTNDILDMATGTLQAWMLENSLKGSPLEDMAAFQAHPFYVSNFTGMPLCELQEPENVGLELGKVFNEANVIYNIQGTQADAVARTLQSYIVSGRRAKVHANGIEWLN